MTGASRGLDLNAGDCATSTDGADDFGVQGKLEIRHSLHKWVVESERRGPETIGDRPWWIEKDLGLLVWVFDGINFAESNAKKE